MTTRLELSIAWRYLRSRRASRLLSFITVIAMGGVVVGVGALVLIMAVMNGLQPGDALLIAGKGHETGQIVGSQVLPFSDHEAVVDALATRVA